jgi:hypothetical protein
MKTIKTSIALLMSIFFLVSCEKDIEFSGKITDPLIVINSIISPDSVISAYISKSKFFLADDTKFDSITDADVSVYINGKFKEKMTYISGGLYKSSFIPNVGDTVSLKTTVSGMQSVNCQTIITPKPEVISVDTTIKSLSYHSIVSYQLGNGGYTSSADTTGASLSYEIKMKIKIQDNAKQQNFYRLMAVLPSNSNDNKYTYSYINITLEGVLSDNQNDPASLINISGSENLFNIFSDELFNGKEFSVVFTITGTNYVKFNNGQIPYLNINLQNLSSDYYKYLYTRGQSLSSDGFFSEPVQIFNNVIGGIGILGSYNNDNNSARINLLDLYKKAVSNGNIQQGYNM